MLKRHEVQVLLKAGHSQVEVAKLTGTSLSSVKRIAGEEAVDHVENAAERERRGIGRPSLVEVAGIRRGVLEKEPELKSLEILRRARVAEGYKGGKSAR